MTQRRGRETSRKGRKKKKEKRKAVEKRKSGVWPKSKVKTECGDIQVIL